ncbi:MAG TPA: hypothetical protein VL360_03675 [Gammaproteobacteria bacterium]|jgi:hypothetical protein|nr:hypothetical protein [Gammaproteobacteria bacterium]
MDYGQYSKGRNQPTKAAAGFRRLTLILFIILLFMIAAYAVFQYKTHRKWVEKISTLHESTMQWLAERKKNMHYGVSKVKNDNDDIDHEQQQVKFEFYSTLQEMKSMDADAHQAVQKELAEKTDKNAGRTASKIKKSQQVNVSRAADLENDLLSAIKNKKVEK